MMTEIQELLDKYLEWLKDKTVVRQLKDWVEITTPYLDRHNDYIQIYAAKRNGGFLLSDDGHTVTDLEQSGCKLESPKRRDLLRTTLNGFGITLGDGVLEVQATPENFALRKHNLVQAILAVNDMFYLAKPAIEDLFFEDVISWLDQNSIRYTQRIKFTGKTGYDHQFDFVIPKSATHPERIIQTITHPSRDKAQAVAFAWIDTKGIRPPHAKAFALLNDAEQKVPKGILDAVRSYDVTPVLWSERKDVQSELAA